MDSGGSSFPSRGVILGAAALAVGAGAGLVAYHSWKNAQEIEEQRQALQSSPAGPAGAESGKELTETLSRVVLIKDDGNKLLQEGQLESALAQYRNAISISEETLLKYGDFSKGSAAAGTTEELVKVRVACFLNAGMMTLKLERWKDTVELCSRAIELGGESAKALYRRAQALVHLEDMANAVKDLRTAYKLTKGTDSLIAKALAKACLDRAGQAAMEGKEAEAEKLLGEAALHGKNQKLRLVEHSACMALGGVHMQKMQANEASGDFARAAEACNPIILNATVAQQEGVTQDQAKFLKCQAMDACSACLMAAGNMPAAESMFKAIEEMVGEVGEQADFIKHNCAGRRAVCYQFKASQLVQMGQWKEAEGQYELLLKSAGALPDGWTAEVAGQDPSAPPGQSAPTLTKVGLEIDGFLMRAHCCDTLLQFDSAKEHLEAALSRAVKTGDTRRECEVRNGKGALLCKVGPLDEAEKECRTSLEASRKINYTKCVASAAGNLGKVLMAQQRKEEALAFFKEAYKLRREGDDPRGAAVQAINLGGGLIASEGDYTQAMKLFEEALTLATQHGLIEMQAMAMRSLVNHLNESGSEPKDQKRALDYREKVLRIMEAQGKGQSDTCPITLDKFGPDDSVVILECFHMVKKAPWDEWVAKKHGEGENPTCPVCRHPTMLH